MPLQPETQEIPLRFGLDITEDEEGQPNGASELVNYDFDQAGALVRRYGFVRSPAYADQISATTGALAFARGANKVQVVTKREVPASVRSVTTLSPAGRRVQSVVSAPDHLDDYTLVALVGANETPDTDWASYDSSYVPSTTYLEMVHNASGRVVWRESIADAWMVRVEYVQDLANDNRHWHVYTVVDAGGGSHDLVFRQVDGTAAAVADELAPVFTLGSPTTFATNLRCNDGHTLPIDSGTSPGVLASSTVVWVDSSGNIKYRRPSYNTTGTLLSATSPGLATERGFVWVKYTASGILNVFYNTGTAIVCANDSNGAGAGGGTWAGTTFNAFPDFFLNQLTAGEVDTDEFIVVTSWDEQIRWQGWNANTRTVLGTERDYEGYRLETQAAVHVFPTAGAPSTDVVVGIAPSRYNPSYPDVTLVSLRQDDPQPILRGRLLVDEHGPMFINADDSRPWNFHGGQLPPFNVTTDESVLRIAMLVTSETGAPETQLSTRDPLVRRVRLLSVGMPDARDPVVTAQLQNVSVVSGSAPLVYDGQTSVPVAFLSQPDTPALSVGAAGSLTGEFSYLVIAEYTDIHGNIQVSPPSEIESQSVTSQQVSVSVSLRLIDGPDAGLMKFRAKVYRTEANGTTFYLRATVVRDANGGPGSDTYTFSDNMSDGELTTGELAYTDGAPTSPLASETLPALGHITTHRNRLFGVDSIVPEVVRYTTEISASVAPRFNAVTTLRVDNQGGPVLAVASLIDKLAIFQENQISIVAGEGPDGNGNGEFSRPETFARVGLMPDQIAGVVETPLGVMFPSRTGIQLLQPDLSVVPIGEAVGDRRFGVDHPIRRARYLAGRSQVWFMTDDVVYVFDLRLKLWTTFQGSSASWVRLVDATEYLGRVLVIAELASENFVVLEMDPSSGIKADADSGTGEATVLFPQVIGAPWFRRDRAQAIRLRKVHVAGRQTASSDTMADVSLEVFTASERSDKSSTVADATYTWPAASIRDMADNFLLTGRVVTQQCRAFRCRLTVTPDDASEVDGPFLTLAAITYDYGVLPGRGKTPANRRPTNT